MSSRLRSISTFSAAILVGAAIVSDTRAAEPIMFRVSIDSVTRDTTLRLIDGTATKTPISPGLRGLARRDRPVQAGTEAGGHAARKACRGWRCRPAG